MLLVKSALPLHLGKPSQAAYFAARPARTVQNTCTVSVEFLPRSVLRIGSVNRRQRLRSSGALSPEGKHAPVYYSREEDFDYYLLSSVIAYPG